MNADGQYLLVRRPGKDPQRVALEDSAPCTIGRAQDSRVVLGDNSVSRNHARVAFRDGSYWVEDLGSKNGTRLNGRLIREPAALTPGDLIEVGTFRIIFSGEAPLSSARIGDAAEPGNVLAVPVAEIVGDPITGTRIQPVAGAASPQRMGFLLQRLDRVGEALMTHRPLKELYQFVVQLTSEVVGADRTALLLRDAGGELAARAVRQMGAGGDDIVVSRTIARRAIEERQAILTRDALSDTRFQAQQSVIRERIHSAMCVPIWNEQEVLGILYVDNVAAAVPFEDADLRLLTLIGHLAAVKIRETAAHEELQKKLEYEQELKRAASIQQALLPTEPLEQAPFRIAGRNLPSLDVGGDYYDYLDTGATIFVGLGDVAGKGMSAALLMTNLHATVRAHLETAQSLPEMTARINKSIYRSARGERFITLFVVSIDRESGRIVYVNAGHNPPILLRASGKVELLSEGGLLLGVFPEAAYESGSTVMGAGDILVLYSDGVVEARDEADEDFGDERLEQFVRSNRERSPREFVDALVRAVFEFSNEGKPGDDVTVAVIRRD
jgi:phosphoserine phosphatase RsbU/P